MQKKGRGKVGRPRLLAENRRSVAFQLRLTPTEHAVLVARARNSQSLAVLIRRALSLPD